MSSYGIEVGEDFLLIPLAVPVELVLPAHGDPTDRGALERALRVRS